MIVCHEYFDGPVPPGDVSERFHHGVVKPEFQVAGWVSSDHFVRGYVLDHVGKGCHDGTMAYRDAAHDAGVASDPNVVPDGHIAIGSRRLAESLAFEGLNIGLLCDWVGGHPVKPVIAAEEDMNPIRNRAELSNGNAIEVIEGVHVEVLRSIGVLTHG